MKSSLSADYVALLAFHHAALVKQVENELPKELEEKLPVTWVELLRDPCAATVRSLWEPAREHLPTFINYQANKIEGAAVVDAYGTPVLLLALSEWREEPMGWEPDFCWVGLPTDQARIAELVAKVGPIPPSLKSLWSVTSFINTRQPSMICSLEPRARELAEEPEIFRCSHSSGMPEDRVCEQSDGHLHDS